MPELKKLYDSNRLPLPQRWLTSTGGQLVFLLVLVTLVVSVVVGAIAHEFARETIRQQAIRTSGIVADARKQALLMRVERRRAGAQEFIEDVAPPHPAIPSHALRQLMKSFLKSNDAIAVRLVRQGSPVVVGDPKYLPGALPAPQPGQVAWFFRGGYYCVAAQRGGNSLIASFSMEEINSIFLNRKGLGSSGESFLVDAEGFFLTPPRYPCASGISHPITARPMQLALSGLESEVLDPDYRGVAMIHGFRHIPEIGGGVIMAHLDQREAFAPVEALRLQLMGAIGLLVLLALIIAPVLALFVTRPLRKLTRRAIALQAEDFERPVPIEGSHEMKLFARTFAEMARSLKASRASLLEANETLERRIDERTRELERQISEKRAIEEADRLKGQFLGIVSHELRTPINAISGFGSILYDGLAGPLTEQQHAYVKKMLMGADTLILLVNDLLDMSQIQSGKLNVSMASFRLEGVMAEVVSTMRPLAEHKEVELVTEISGPLPETYGDARRMAQVLTNLIGNAIKFMPRGGTAWIRLHEVTEGVRCEIVDSGPGIAPQDLPRLFQRFMQIDMSNTREFSGTGLGLAISQAIMEAHGTEISVKSILGEGSTFWFTLPLHRPQTGADAPAATETGSKAKQASIES